MSNDKKSPKPSAEPEIMEKIVSLCKQRGFVFQSSEIYGGLKSCYDYGPLGAELKRNVKAEWWRTMVHGRDDIVGLDASIMMHPDVWRASGHLAGFADEMSTCKFCKKSVRSDHAWDVLKDSAWFKSLGEIPLPITMASLKKWVENKGKRLAPGLEICRNNEFAKEVFGVVHDKPDEPVQVESTEQIACLLAKSSVSTAPCPECGGELMAPRKFNLMFRTSIGPVDPVGEISARLAGKTLDAESIRAIVNEVNNESAVYLRPETAQAMFVNFLNVQASMRMKPPFGIAQQGKSFRNEITVKHFTFRSCEFEQMEMEFFVPPPQYAEEGKDDMYWYNYWCQQRLAWYSSLGIRPEKLRLRPHESSELAHYAKACSDVEYEYPWGWGELEGIAHRGDYDLKQHETHSGKKLTYFDPQRNVHYHPFVIEPAAGADRAALAFLLDAYVEEPPPPGTTEGRTVLRLHPRLAPIKVAVFPLVKKEGMPDIARKIVAEFRKHQIIASYDEKDAIGRRYRRQDECGTPYCITVDGQTSQDNTVTIRERDSMKQVRIQIDEAVNTVRAKLS